ncbi:BTB/POZ domain-containing protein SETH6 [Capsicum annuum]|nr:BTB/POZ domain-containing protein SETH6 [Capsicum annuum]
MVSHLVFDTHIGAPTNPDRALQGPLKWQRSEGCINGFPLVSRSEKIRKLLLETKDTKVSRINLTSLPGGSDAFELAAKFCYGVNVEISISNVALLRCATRFMKMTEDISEKNLEIRTEVFLKDAVFSNISNLISVLHCCETLLLISEEVNLVSQLTNPIANNACKEQLTFGLSKLEYNFSPKPVQCIDSETPSAWCGKSLAVLNLDFFQRVLSVVKIKGLKQDIISKFLINYAQNSLQGLFIKDLQLVKGSFLDLDL